MLSPLATTSTPATRSASTPLVVDLDGTLVHTDLLLESALQFVRKHPWQTWRLFSWLARGKAALKTALAERVDLHAASLPYNQELLVHLKAEKTRGRSLVLATASHEKYAQAVAAHLQLFDSVLATNSQRNLSSTAKRDALLERYRPQGFDYAGNAMDDLAVWSASRQGLMVRPERGVAAKAATMAHVQAFGSAGPGWRPWLRALRPHQWMKNLLIFVPLFASGQLNVPHLLALGLLAFVAFGLCASSVYVLNDLLDLAEDRQHPRKRLRPFAAGTLPLLHGLLACPLLLLAAFSIGLAFLPPLFNLCLALYFGLTLTYSLSLKQMAIVDVVVLALLYTQRIVAGTFAFELPPTFWLLAFSMFIFFSLAMVKRYGELHGARNLLMQGTVRGRGYMHSDLEIIASLGAAAGYISVLVMALYVQDKATSVQYRQPELLWLLCPLLLFWISRIWLLTHRGQMHDDPVVFAIKDKTSLAVGAVFLAILWAAK